MDYLLLIINPGSTSTKVAIFRQEQLLHEQVLKHEARELQAFSSIIDQADFRKAFILEFLSQKGHRVEDFDVFVARGGILKPLPQGGTYAINARMLEDLQSCTYGAHASNLGAILADLMARPLNRPAYIVDPVCVDEMDDIAKVSGLKGMDRISVFHVLNQKAIARKHAKIIGQKYENLNLIVCHLGGGVSVGLHQKGRVVDVNNALGGDGPFSPERTGTLPTYPLVEMCFSGQYTKEEVKRMLVGQGGLVSYLGTANGIEIDQRIRHNDQEAAFYFRAMAYRVAKEIGSLYFAVSGELDGILITGGLAHNDLFISHLRSYIDPIFPLHVYPGEDEMRALALGALRVLAHEEKAQTYE
ncbi:MAG: butyrate kinase [Candidatus Izemoplasmatales bacterium]|nr:butyrate kinase [Candidatus Izemoplasmatales bacterium]